MAHNASSGEPSFFAAPMYKLKTLPEVTVFRYAASAVCGALIGVFCSFVTNCTLVEISINPFFAIYFGVMFLIIAAAIYWRVHASEPANPVLLKVYTTLVGFGWSRPPASSLFVNTFFFLLLLL
jgi:hypothetical protein